MNTASLKNQLERYNRKWRAAFDRAYASRKRYKINRKRHHDRIYLRWHRRIMKYADQIIEEITDTKP